VALLSEKASTFALVWEVTMDDRYAIRLVRAQTPHQSTTREFGSGCLRKSEPGVPSRRNDRRSSPYRISSPWLI